jgi:hypothetical protein
VADDDRKRRRLGDETQARIDDLAAGWELPAGGGAAPDSRRSAPAIPAAAPVAQGRGGPLRPGSLDRALDSLDDSLTRSLDDLGGDEDGLDALAGLDDDEGDEGGDDLRAGSAEARSRSASGEGRPGEAIRGRAIGAPGERLRAEPPRAGRDSRGIGPPTPSIRRGAADEDDLEEALHAALGGAGRAARPGGAAHDDDLAGSTDREAPATSRPPTPRRAHPRPGGNRPDPSADLDAALDAALVAFREPAPAPAPAPPVRRDPGARSGMRAGPTDTGRVDVSGVIVDREPPPARAGEPAIEAALAATGGGDAGAGPPPPPRRPSARTVPPPPPGARGAAAIAPPATPGPRAPAMPGPDPARAPTAAADGSAAIGRAQPATTPPPLPSAPRHKPGSGPPPLAAAPPPRASRPALGTAAEIAARAAADPGPDDSGVAVIAELSPEAEGPGTGPLVIGSASDVGRDDPTRVDPASAPPPEPVGRAGRGRTRRGERSGSLAAPEASAARPGSRSGAAHARLRTIAELQRRRGLGGDLRYVWTAIFGLRRTRRELAAIEAAQVARQASRRRHLVTLGRAAISAADVAHAALAEARAHLAGLDEERARHAAEVAAAESELQRATAARAERASQHAAELSALERQVAEQGRQLEPLEKARAAIARRAVALRDAVRRIDEKIAFTEASLSAVKTQKEDRAGILAEIASLKADRQGVLADEPALAAELDALQPRIAKHEASRAELRERRAEAMREEELDQRRTAEILAAVGARRKVLDRAVSDADARRDRLQFQLGEQLYVDRPDALAAELSPIDAIDVELGTGDRRAMELREIAQSVDRWKLARGALLWLMLLGGIGALAWWLWDTRALFG